MRRSDDVGLLILSDMESEYKYTFFDYRNVTDMDFLIAVDMGWSVKQAWSSTHRNP